MSSVDNSSNSRAILTLYIEDDLLKCKIRTYDMPKLNRYCKIGVYHNNIVTSANLIERNGVYSSSLVGEYDIEQDFYCAIINTEYENTPIVAGGSYAGYYFNDDSVFRQDTVEKEDITPDIDSQTLPNCENNEDRCKNCKYKEYFYSNENQVYTDAVPQENIQSPEEENIEEQIDSISSLMPQFDYIFKEYPENNLLNSLIPNSKFVDIKDKDSEYSIGAIYNEEKIKVICYATPSRYNTPAPTELGEHYQWLPIDSEDPLSDGYYIVFQDANTLKIVDL